MTARTLSTLVVTGLIVSLPVYAQTVTGDIVDQILHPTPPPPATAPSQPPVAMTQPSVPPPTVAPAAAIAMPAPSVAPAAGPTPFAPPLASPNTTPAPVSPFPVSTMGSPDIVGTTVSPGNVSLPPEPPLASRWGGFYGGINLGGGWTEGTSASSCFNSVTNNASGCTLINPSGPNTAGLVGGGQFGYITPFDPGWGLPLVVGAEVDLEGSGMSGTQSIAPPIPLVDFPPCTTCSFYAKQSLDWMASLRARVGVPVDDMLIYATGGLMFGGANAYQSLSFTNANSGSYTVSAHEALAGPTFGGGVEYRLPGPWSVRLEGLYYDLGKMRTVAEPTGDAFVNFSNTKTFAFRGGIIRLAVNLRLGDIGWGF
jgi:outer membrane immunogenic protein